MRVYQHVSHYIFKMQGELMATSKRLDIELMRIVATFFVIFNHTGDKGFFLFSLYDAHSIQYWIYLFISVFCKFSVPLFFMIAGSLLLNWGGVKKQ